MAHRKILYEGHAPGEVRDVFLDAVDRMFDAGKMSQKLLMLCEQLRRCEDVLPGITCDVLGLPAGSSYGEGAEALLRRGPSAPTRQ